MSVDKQVNVVRSDIPSSFGHGAVESRIKSGASSVFGDRGWRRPTMLAITVFFIHSIGTY